MTDIREIEENELMDLFDIEQISFKNSYRISTLADMYGKPSYKFLGIFNRNRLAGYIILLDSIDIYEVVKIAISPIYRGRGLGKKLLTSVLENLDKNLMLEVRVSNETAINLYEGLGFKKINIRKGYYGDTGEDGIVYLFETSFSCN
ncbi:ribosomal protein S18-alanine N-acetyltransferase [Psychrilyobacter atlanticus]|uniref:ribosomal protein S18-alanine N-acetyltransferase n=1 Tax=Psychrilyobacter atlanticus TaxID=271091 RepID=UPI0004267BCE|nr:ribosomal protein S18-alanine N-acetyltransferase [Psychrilyobacter atlanticus]